MAELTVRRVVFACDAACDIRAAVEGAAALAKQWNAALHGVFLDDENLYRLAGLPFGHQVTLSSAVFESFSATDLEKLSSVQGAAMRRAVAEAASQLGLEWSFGVVRDLPTVAALAGIEGDILVLQGATRPFAGSWRPRSSWDNLSETYARTILIRRQPRGSARAGIVMMWLAKGDDCERILRSGLAMAGSGDELVALLRNGSPADFEAAKRIGESVVSSHGRKIRLEEAPADLAALLRQIERLQPAVLVVAAGAAEGPAVRDLLAGTRCDLLLVR